VVLEPPAFIAQLAGLAEATGLEPPTLMRNDSSNWPTLHRRPTVRKTCANQCRSVMHSAANQDIGRPGNSLIIRPVQKSSRTFNLLAVGSIPTRPTILFTSIPVIWFTPYSGHMVNTFGECYRYRRKDRLRWRQVGDGKLSNADKGHQRPCMGGAASRSPQSWGCP
jgi:hypothetical protein